MCMLVSAYNYVSVGYMLKLDTLELIQDYWYNNHNDRELTVALSHHNHVYSTVYGR